MSAYIVSREHIQYLISSMEMMEGRIVFCHNGKIKEYETPEEKTQLGQMLWDTNIVSVKTRYWDETIQELPSGESDKRYKFKYRFVYFIPNPVQVIKSAQCYEYQCCEYIGWEDSEAKAFTDALIHVAISKLPGYREAEWGCPKDFLKTNKEVI